MKTMRASALRAVRNAMREVVDEFGEDACNYLRDAVDFHLVGIDNDRMDLCDLDVAISEEIVARDVVAVLSDGGHVHVDLDSGRVEVRDE